MITYTSGNDFIMIAAVTEARARPRGANNNLTGGDGTRTPSTWIYNPPWYYIWYYRIKCDCVKEKENKVEERKIKKKSRVRLGQLGVGESSRAQSEGTLRACIYDFMYICIMYAGRRALRQAVAAAEQTNGIRTQTLSCVYACTCVEREIVPSDEVDRVKTGHGESTRARPQVRT